jgi:hypothetical protein
LVDGRYLVKVGAGYVQGDSEPYVLDLGEVLNRSMVGARIGAGLAGLLKRPMLPLKHGGFELVAFVTESFAVWAHDCLNETVLGPT